MAGLARARLPLVAALLLGASGCGGDAVPDRCAVAGPGDPAALSGTFGEKLTVVVPRDADDPPPEGTTLGNADEGGAVRAKILWRRGRRARGRLSVEGRRLGGDGVLTASIDQGHVSFAPSTLTFPSAGCWRITATSGGARAEYVVRVVDHSR